jgi:hypothetical protein
MGFVVQRTPVSAFQHMKNAASIARRWLVLCLLCAAALPAAAQTAASLSYTEGKVLLLRGATTYGLEPGVKLGTGDMLETSDKSQAQIEFADGMTLNMGPKSRLYLLSVTPSGGSSTVALASGWLKAVLPAKGKGAARELQYLLPTMEIDTKDATLVMHAAAPADEIFVESGAAAASDLNTEGAKGPALAVKGGDYIGVKESAITIGRPPTGFFGGVPKYYMDNLPNLYAKVKDVQREPARDHDTSYTEAAVWLNANKTVRHGLVARYQPRLKDAEFRAGIAATLGAHPEWEKVLDSAKKK